jgi:hypothetical protein
MVNRPTALSRSILTPPKKGSGSALDRLLRFYGVNLATVFTLDRGTIMDRGFIKDSLFVMNSRIDIDRRFVMS